MPSLSSSAVIPQDICILRLSALGDVCNLVPSVRALQKAAPQMHITWVIGRAEYNLLKGLEGVEFLVYDKKTGLKGMMALRKTLLKQRQGRPFDALLHMQAALRASVLSRFIPAKRRIGFDAARAKDFQGWFVNEKISPNPNSKVCTGFMDFVKYLDVPVGVPEWNIPVPLEAKNAAQVMTEDVTPYLLINPCANSRKRNWRNWEDYDGMAEVIDYAYHQYGLHSLIVGGKSAEEQEAGREIQARARVKTHNLLGKTSLKELLALIEQAQMVITPDSGPVHMAVAMGTPAIGLYATTNPDRGGPWIDDYVVNRYSAAVKQYLKKDVNQLSWGQRVRNRNAMSVIKVADVIEQVDAVMRDTRASGEKDEN